MKGKPRSSKRNFNKHIIYVIKIWMKQKVDLSVARRNRCCSLHNEFSLRACNPAVQINSLKFVFFFLMCYLVLLVGQRKKSWLMRSGPLHSWQFYIGLVCFSLWCWAQGGTPRASCPQKLKPDQLNYSKQPEDWTLDGWPFYVSYNQSGS